MKRIEFGIKIWAKNDLDTRIEQIEKLLAEGYYSFVEVMAVPGSFEQHIHQLQRLKCPFVIHAAHCSFGVDISCADKEQYNRDAILEAIRYADALNAKHIVVHLPFNDNVDETVRQLLLLGDARVVVENMPPINREDAVYAGTGIDYLNRIVEETCLGACIDLAHTGAMAWENKLDLAQQFMLFSRVKTRKIFHVSDELLGVQDHLNFGDGDINVKDMFAYIEDGSMVVLECAVDPLGDHREARANIEYLRTALS